MRILLGFSSVGWYFMCKNIWMESILFSEVLHCLRALYLDILLLEIYWVPCFCSMLVHTYVVTQLFCGQCEIAWVIGCLGALKLSCLKILRHLCWSFSLFYWAWCYVLNDFWFIANLFHCYFRDMLRLADVLKSKNEENEAYLSEIEVCALLVYVD